MYGIILEALGASGILFAAAWRLSSDMYFWTVMFGSPIIPILVLGVFFSVSGWRKLFLPEVRAHVFKFMHDGLHIPRAMVWTVMLGEYAGGMGLLSGIMWREAAAGLIPIMLGAFFMSTVPDIARRQPAEISAWCAELLCNPELLILSMLATIVLF